MVKAKRKSARRPARKSRSKAKSKAKPKSVTVAALKRAVEGRDAEALAAMYADNAVMLGSITTTRRAIRAGSPARPRSPAISATSVVAIWPT
jgi:hypothetical protein